MARTMPPLPRVVVGVLAAIGLLLVVVRLEQGKASVWPAVVMPAQTFRLSGLSPGRYSWTLEDSRVAGGAGFLSQRTLEFERNDLVSIELAPGVASGVAVKAGSTLATLRSSFQEDTLATLRAERAVAVARRDLLAAGGRPETVAAAQRAVEVARALAEGAAPEANRARSLLETGAGSAAQVEQADLARQVAVLQARLAEAQAAEARATPRPEEISAIEAEIALLDTRIKQAEDLVGQREVVSPIDGVVLLGQLTEVTGDTTVLRVQALQPLVLRVPVPEHSRASLSAGAPLRFRSNALEDTDFIASIYDISPEAAPLNGQQVFWVSALVDGAAGQLAPGTTGWASLGEAGGT